jgi:hypothetical protein
MSDRALTILVHGLAGAGKTTFGATGPTPILILDVEKAARFIKGRKKKWNPLVETPPVADGTWDICVVSVDSFDKALKAYEYLKSGRHPFKTVVVDSISELQSKAVEKIKGRQQLQTQDWGKLLSAMSFFCRDLRDLTDDDNIIEAVIITAMSRDYDGIIKPYLQGQIASQVPYWMDITGYLYVTQTTDQTTGEVKDTRNLLIGNHPNYEAKSRVPGLPTVISEPNVTRMLNEIFGEDVAEVQQEAPAVAAPVAQEPVAVNAGMPEKPVI